MQRVNIVRNQSLPIDIELLLDFIEKLSVQQKSLIIERLIGNNSELSVVLGNQLSNSIMEQIDRMSFEQLSGLLEAIASRIRNET